MAVLFPAPFGPSSATTWPGAHDKVDAVQHLDLSVSGGDATKLEHRRRALRPAGGLWSFRAGVGGARPLRDVVRRRRPVAEVSVEHGLVATDLFRRSDRDEYAVVQHMDRVAHIHDEPDVVLDEEDRRPLSGERVEQLGERLGLAVAESRGRLVEQEQTRLYGERAAYLAEAGQTGRKRVGSFIGHDAQADAIEDDVRIAVGIPT